MVALSHIGKRVHIPSNERYSSNGKHEIMETSRHTSPIILVTAVIAGSLAFIQQNGFFDGIFHREILASVSVEETVGAAKATAVDHATTAVVH